MQDQELIEEIRQLNKTMSKLNRQSNFLNSFIRGVLSGLGSVVGATIVVAFLAFMLRNVSFVPLIGGWLAEIINYASQLTTPQ
ncbi:hypothetical protein KJZ63_04185 [Patescibacteria group bacterium]|nr:hypothetical protein [Patescibacteria group bacterium]